MHHDRPEITRLLIVPLACACLVGALLWPHWREEIYAQTYCVPVPPHQVKNNEHDVITPGLPRPLAAALGFIGIKIDAKVDTLLNLWEGKDCCNGVLTGYEKGTLDFLGVVNEEFDIINVKPVKAFVDVVNGLLGIANVKTELHGGFSVQTTADGTIEQKWENCKRKFDGWTAFGGTMSLNGSIVLKSVSSGQVLMTIWASGSVSAEGTFNGPFSGLGWVMPTDFTGDGCFKITVDIPAWPGLGPEIEWCIDDYL